MKHSKLPENEFLYLTAEHDTRGRVGFLPIGSLENHGGTLPLGTDLLITRACAHAFARAVDGIVFPELAYGYCPNTALLAGTLSPRAEVLLPYLMEVCRQTHRMCERLILVNIHRGNDALISLAVDELFGADGTALFYVDPYTLLGKALDDELFPGRDNSYKEAALLHAALRLLGDPAGYAADGEEQGNKPPELSLLRQNGKLGFAYPSAAAHIAARTDIDVEAGLRYYDAATARVVELVAAWKRVSP